MSRQWERTAALVLVFCTAEALYTVHEEPVSFSAARSACAPDGVLPSMASDGESRLVLSSVAATLTSSGNFSFWVGLWKPAGTCVRADLPLYGFLWTSTNGSDSTVSRWRKNPVKTCIGERCGMLSLNFDGGKVTSWGWADSSCGRAHGFVCQSKSAATSPPDVNTGVSPCLDGQTVCGKRQLPSTPQNAHPALPSTSFPVTPGPPSDRIQTTNAAPSLTTSSKIISQIRDGAADKYSLFIPVLGALLALVVLVVVVLVVIKFCFKRRPKKTPHSKNGRKPEVTVALSTTDPDGAETTA